MRFVVAESQTSRLRSLMAIDPASVVATALASALGTATAGAIGFRYAIAKFRRERSFEWRLTWHEAAVRELVDAAGRLIRALNTVRKPELAPRRAEAWGAVGDSFSKLLGLQTEAELYASNAGYEAIVSITEDVRALSTAAERIARLRATDEAFASQGRDEFAVYDTIVTLLLHGASRLAKDVRRELELEELDRENRIYDDDFVAHLEDIKAKGFAASDTIESPARAERSSPQVEPQGRTSNDR